MQSTELNYLEPVHSFTIHADNRHTTMPYSPGRQSFRQNASPSPYEQVLATVSKASLLVGVDIGLGLYYLLVRFSSMDGIWRRVGDIRCAWTRPPCHPWRPWRQ